MRKGISKRLACLVALITVTTNSVAFAQEIKKDETVYVILDENGNPTEQIVSDWIKGSEALGEFTDKSTLTDIKNVKGDEEPTKNGENLSWNINSNELYYQIKGSEALGEFTDKSTLTDIKNVKGDEEPTKNGENLSWNINSNELYYQGKSSNKLPITISVNYEFNGKKVDPNDVLGKSGKFKISVNIKNNESKTVFINGEKRTIYLPLLTAAELTLSNSNFKNVEITSGKVLNDGNNSLVTFVINGEKRTIYLPLLTAAELTLSNSNFKNVEITSGKVLNDGNNSLVTFVTIPGLKESLNLGGLLDDLLGSSSIDLEDSFEITGETEKFEIPAIMVLATTSSEDIDEIQGIDKLDDLKTALNDLQKGGEDLLSGSKELLDGQTDLANSYSIFDSGVDTLNSGAIELKNGINKLNSNVPTLVSGANSLNSGASELNTKYSLFDTGVSSFH